MIALRLAVRMLARDWRAGESGILALALVLAVTALVAVTSLADRVEQGVQQQAHQVLGGDLLLSADHAWPDEYRRQAGARGLAVAESAVLMSMAMFGEEARLVEIKAVGAGYPLRGALLVAESPGAPQREQRAPPGPGTAWIAESIAIGGMPPQLQIGDRQLAVAGILTRDPEQGLAAFGLAPRIVVHLDDLAASGLVQPGSRIGWRLHVAGPAAAVAGFRDWATARLGRGERLETIDNARPEMTTLLERAGHFLRLSAVLTLILSAAAIALAADRYLRRHLDACAVMRCLGASSRTLVVVHGGAFLLLAALSTVAGVLSGLLTQQILLTLLGGVLIADLPPPSWQAAGQGAAAGLLLAAGFLLPPLLGLLRVATVRVFRREWQALEGRRIASHLLGALALVLLIVWLAGGWRLGLIVVAGFALALVLAAGIAALAMTALRRLPLRRWSAWNLGLAGLLRRRETTLLQIVALALGLTALLVLTIARSDLLSTWRQRLPADAPNRFVINLQDDQRAAFAAYFEAHGLAAPKVEPMVRGRLEAINDVPVEPGRYPDERARRLVEREFNLSWMSVLPDGNSISAGRWFGDDQAAQFSVEQGLAETLGIRLGDRLGYRIGGELLTGPVTSLRKLEWDSMRVNFFVVTPPAALQGRPASYITSFHLPADAGSFANDLVRRFPNLTVIDVGMMIRQLQDTLDQVARAVEVLFVLALAAGLVVLYAGIEAGADQRRRELALMRALGGRRRHLRWSMTAEFLAMGALGGLLAGGAAAGMAWALGQFAFHLDYRPSVWLPLAGIGAGALGVAATGLLLTRGILSRPLTSDLWSGD